MTGPDYVLAMFARLHPAPLVVRRASGTRPHQRARYLLLPTQGQPRLIVPAGRPFAAARAARRQLNGDRLRTRAARLATTFAVGSGLFEKAVRLHLVVEGPADTTSVEGLLRSILGVDDLLLAMSVGQPRATRKPVLQVFDARGNVLAFVKIGHDPLTRRLVESEAQTLQRLGRAVLRSTRAPRVLGLERWAGLSLLVLEPLPVRGRRLRGEAQRDALVTSVREIALLPGSAGPSWRKSPMREALNNELTTSGDRAGGLLREFERLDHEPVDVRLGCWHGDLNPGNMAALRTQTLVWDWERFEQGVPVGYDLLHHDLQTWITEQGTPPLEAAHRLLVQAAQMLAPLGVPPEAAEQTARLYLLTLGSRYARDQQAEAGSHVGNVDTWIVPALQAVPGSPTYRTRR